MIGRIQVALPEPRELRLVPVYGGVDVPICVPSQGPFIALGNGDTCQVGAGSPRPDALLVCAASSSSTEWPGSYFPLDLVPFGGTASVLTEAIVVESNSQSAYRPIGYVVSVDSQGYKVPSDVKCFGSVIPTAGGWPIMIDGLPMATSGITFQDETGVERAYPVSSHTSRIVLE